jgi:hypothetical protein
MVMSAMSILMAMPAVTVLAMVVPLPTMVVVASLMVLVGLLLFHRATLCISHLLQDRLVLHLEMVHLGNQIALLHLHL